MIPKLMHHYLFQKEELRLKTPSHLEGDCSISIHQAGRECTALLASSTRTTALASQQPSKLSPFSAQDAIPLGFVTDQLTSQCMCLNILSIVQQHGTVKKGNWLINYTQIKTADACSLWHPEIFSTYALSASFSFCISSSTYSSCFSSILIRSWQVVSSSLKQINRLFTFSKFSALSH